MASVGVEIQWLGLITRSSMLFLPLEGYVQMEDWTVDVSVAYKI